MPDAVRAAVLERLPDGWRAERLARMDRDREVLAAAELKRFDMRLRRMAGLLACDVEADNTALTVRDRKLRHLERIGAVTHRTDDLAERDAAFALGALEPLLHGLDDLLVVETARGVEYRRVADLRVNDPVAREILAALVRDALERLFGLHHRDGVREAAQIEGERSGGRTTVEPAAKLGGVRRRKARVADVARELDDRCRTQATVEMVVQQDLRRRAQRLQRDHVGVNLAAGPAAEECPDRDRQYRNP